MVKTTIKPKKLRKEKALKATALELEKKGTVVKKTAIKVDKTDKSETAKLKVTVPKIAEENVPKKEKYYQTIGRRKESIAVVRLFTKKSTDVIDGNYALVTVNDKDYRNYFSDKTLQYIVESPLRKLKSLNRFKATVRVFGGGMSGQADAIKHGLARALVTFDQNFRKKLKKSGFLTRDPRVKERRKYGLKKARKAPAWSKR